MTDENRRARGKRLTRRRYRKSLRAEHEQQTRQRITEAAVDLHGTIGPARTSISALAQQAGVRRSTIYRHFPDELALFTACSAHWLAANPFPDIAQWAAIDDADERLRCGLRALYTHYRRTKRMMMNVLRDEPLMPILTKMLDGYRHYLITARDALMEGRKMAPPVRRRVRAVIGHALAFPTWRSLAVEQGLNDAEIAGLMRRMVTVSSERDN